MYVSMYVANGLLKESNWMVNIKYHKCLCVHLKVDLRVGPECDR